jgi:hypothetical protein
MPLHADYNLWLRTVGRESVYLAKLEFAQYSGAATPTFTEQYIRVGTRSFDSVEGTFAPTMNQGLVISKNARGSTSAFTQGGNITINNINGRYDEYIGYDPVEATLYFGDPSWLLSEMKTFTFPILFFGAISEELIEVQLGEYGVQMDADILQNKISSYGSEQWKPHLYGDAARTFVVMIDDATGMLHDGAIEDGLIPLRRTETYNPQQALGYSDTTKNLTTGEFDIPAGLIDLAGDYGAIWAEGTAGVHGGAASFGSNNDWRSLPHVANHLVTTYAGLTVASTEYTNFINGFSYNGVTTGTIAPTSISLPIKNQISVRTAINVMFKEYPMWVTSNDAGEVVFGFLEPYPWIRPRWCYFTETGTDRIELSQGQISSNGGFTNEYITITGASDPFFNAQWQISSDDGPLNYAENTYTMNVTGGAGKTMDYANEPNIRFAYGQLSQPDANYMWWSTNVLTDVEDLVVEMTRPRSPINFSHYDPGDTTFVRSPLRNLRNEEFGTCTPLDCGPGVHTDLQSNSYGYLKSRYIWMMHEPGSGFVSFRCIRHPETLGWDLGTKFVLMIDRFGWDNGIPCQVVSIIKNFDQGTGETQITAWSGELAN